MASLNTDKTERRHRIQFTVDRTRYSVSLKFTRAKDQGLSKAAIIKNHIEELVTARKFGTAIGQDLTNWAAKLDESIHQTLVKAGLLERRADISLSKLGPFLEQWFKDREDTKRSTELTWRHAERNLKAYFGESKSLREITIDDAENFQRWLLNPKKEKLSKATVRKRISIVKQMMASAVKKKLLSENPFAGFKTASLPSPKKRQKYVTHDETQRLFDACTNAEWRAIVALGRYGGLRIPSEIRELKWCDINWEVGTVYVHAIKTEHHDDEGDRIVPLFPELRQHLWNQHEAVEDGSVYVLPNLRHTTNVLPTLHRIIKRAGMVPWPKAWQNMRASRATELEDHFGAFKAAEWMGHCEKIAREFYLQVTEDHLERATQFVSAKARTTPSGAKPVQNSEELKGIASPTQ